MNSDQPGLVVTSTGAYNLDYEGSYQKRKQEQPLQYKPLRERPLTQMEHPREKSREEIIQSLERSYEDNRSRSRENRSALNRSVADGFRSIEGSAKDPEPRRFTA